MLELKNKWKTTRFVGRTVVKAVHWLNTIPKPKKGEKPSRKPASFPKPCLGAYIADDGSTQIDAKKCPYCSVLEDNPRLEAFVNAIDRDVQENPPKRMGKPTRYEKKKQKLSGGVAFYKEDKDTELWTPVRLVRVTPSLARKISEIAGLNTRKTSEGKKAFGPEHPKFGFDLLLKFDKDAKAAGDMYSAQKAEKSKLSEEEASFARWAVPEEKGESEQEAEKEAKRIKPYLCDREMELKFPDENRKAKKGGDSDKHKKYRDQFDEDDEDEDDDEDDRKSSKKKRNRFEDDDDDDRPSKKSKSKKRSRDDDEDEDEDDFDEDTDDEDEDDDDDDRRSSKKSKSKKSSKKRSRDDDDEEDDEDEDEEDDDEDEEDDRRSKKSSKKSKSSKKRSRDDDEDDDDLDDEDDDEDEDEDDDDESDRRKSKKSKSKKSSKKSSKSKSKKRSRDDDDDLDDDDDEDEDYDEDYDDIPF